MDGTDFIEGFLAARAGKSEYDNPYGIVLGLDVRDEERFMQWRTGFRVGAMTPQQKETHHA